MKPFSVRLAALLLLLFGKGVSASESVPDLVCDVRNRNGETLQPRSAASSIGSRGERAISAGSEEFRYDFSLVDGQAELGLTDRKTHARGAIGPVPLARGQRLVLEVPTACPGERCLTLDCGWSTELFH